MQTHNTAKHSLGRLLPLFCVTRWRRLITNQFLEAMIFSGNLNPTVPELAGYDQLIDGPSRPRHCREARFLSCVRKTDPSAGVSYIIYATTISQLSGQFTIVPSSLFKPLTAVSKNQATSRLIRIMGQPSFQASNAIVYVTYGVFLYVKPLGVRSCSRSQDKITNSRNSQYNGNCARLEIPSGIQGRVPFWKQNSDRSEEYSQGEMGADEAGACCDQAPFASS